MGAVRKREPKPTGVPAEWAHRESYFLHDLAALDDALESGRLCEIHAIIAHGSSLLRVEMSSGTYYILDTADARRRIAAAFAR